VIGGMATSPGPARHRVHVTLRTARSYVNLQLVMFG
jgi:hypothetical protein